MSAFSVSDPSTWPALLSLDETAQIFRRSADAIRHGCTPRTRRPFQPVPAMKRPLRWRKSDVCRWIESARA